MSIISIFILIATAVSISSYSLQLGKSRLPQCQNVAISSGRLSQQLGIIMTRKFSTYDGNQIETGDKSAELLQALTVLKLYDAEYLLMSKQARTEGRPLALLQLERAQKMKGEAVKAEREELKAAVLLLAKESDSVTLGIMAESGGRAVRTLKAWVSALELPRGVLRAVDESSGEELELCDLAESTVYLKYGPAKSGDAYMKAYAGGNIGVIFQPKLKFQKVEEFYQFGDLPLSTFI